MKKCPQCGGSGKQEAWDEAHRRIFRSPCSMCRKTGYITDEAFEEYLVRQVRKPLPLRHFPKVD